MSTYQLLAKADDILEQVETAATRRQVERLTAVYESIMARVARLRDAETGRAAS